MSQKLNHLPGHESHHLDLPDDVLAAFCPVLFLHHRDAYFPASVEWFLERAQLVYYLKGVFGTGEDREFNKVPGGVQRLIPDGQVTQDKLMGAQANCQDPKRLSITISPEHYAGYRPDHLNEAPLYVHTKLIVNDNGQPEAYEINYITFYAFNGNYRVPGCLPIFSTGQHVSDWEHLTVSLDAATRELQGVWYNSHRNIEGEWRPAARVPRTPCGRIIGYVAKDGHGIYPTCGTIPRIFCMVNDHTSRRGPVWNPKSVVRLSGLASESSLSIATSRGCSLPPVVKGAPGNSGGTGSPAFPLPQAVHDTSEWQRFQGRWGSITTPTGQCWFKDAEPPVSRGWFKRVFWPCAPGVDRLPPRKQSTGCS